jgi:hypothetical protein
MKKQNKKSKTKVRRIMYKTAYPARVLALVLGGIMFLEGMLFGVTTTTDLSQGMQLLDMSAAISTTQTDLAWLAEPLVLTVNGVNDFYVLASQELIVLLEDNFFNNALSVVYDVDSFYKVAAREMASALDISGVLSANAYNY